jgi:hypothetical protein
MQEYRDDLDTVFIALPRLKEALGEDGWLKVVGQLQTCASAFQNLRTEAELRHAVDQLFEPLTADKRIAAILVATSSNDPKLPFEGQRRSRWSSTGPGGIDVPTIAEEFYRLCRDPEAALHA